MVFAECLLKLVAPGLNFLATIVLQFGENVVTPSTYNVYQSGWNRNRIRDKNVACAGKFGKSVDEPEELFNFNYYSNIPYHYYHTLCIITLYTTYLAIKIRPSDTFVILIFEACYHGAILTIA